MSNEDAIAPDTDAASKKAVPMVPFFQLFRFAAPFDYFLMIVGSISGMATGAALSGFVIIFGDVLDSLNSPDPSLAAAVSVQFVYLALGVWFAATLQVACWTAAAERMTIKMRHEYLDAILAQDIAYFDAEGTGKLAAKIAENSIIFRQGLGDKLGNLNQFGAMFLSGIIVSAVYVWQLTLAVLAIAPFLALSGYLMSKAMSDAVTGQLASYAKAGSIADETLRLIRTVTAFNMQDKQIAKYETELKQAAKQATKQGISSGLGMGTIVLFYFASYSIAFWVGAVVLVNSKNDAVARFPIHNASLVPEYCQVGQEVPLQCSSGARGVFFDTEADVCGCPMCRCGCYPSQPDEDVNLDNQCVTGGSIVLAYFAILLGSFAIGQSGPGLTALASARSAAFDLYKVLDRKPEIDAASTEGIVLETCRGELKFDSVHFKYPTRDQMILKNLSLTIPAGQRVALVGESGSGKSTIIQLLERYYDPQQGSLYLDGIAYKDINLSSLRRLIGLVSQEPVLFATSVMENVRYGRPSATDEEVIEACKQANAHMFIQSFASSPEDAYNTFVTSSLVSGGQKQRLAIARALLRNPPILLLDEATAALDNESERLVNEAIDKLLLTSRTTIVIAHRLSSIQTCDHIFVLDHGQLVEEGAPAALATKENGHYAALLKLSTGGAPQNTDVVEDAEIIADKEVNEDGVQPAATLISKQEPIVNDGQVEVKQKNYPIRYAFRYSAPDRLLFIPAIVFACIDGLLLPVFGLIFSEVLATLFAVNSNELLEQAKVWCLAFLGLAVVGGLAVFFEFIFFGIISGRTTQRARTESFRHVMSMEIGYFDLKENNVGALTSRLGSDCGLLKTAISDRLQLGTINLATLVSGLAIAFAGSWKVTLVTICIMPFMVIAGVIELTVLSGMANADQKANAESAHTLTEAVNGIRTVAAFEMQQAVSNLYMEQLHGPFQKAVKKGMLGGMGFGFSQATTYFSYALAFWYGSTLVAAGEISFQQLNQSLFGILMTAMSLGQCLAMFPDIGKGQSAVNSIFGALARKSKIDPFSPDGQKPSVVVGDISFENIQFAYPSRPEITVLENFNLEVKRGQTVAFVGTSGSGKSTLVLLLERFYDPLGSKSSVKIDGVDVRELNLEWLRSQIGIVSQEPSLFQGTIADNIRNGKLDATEEEVVEAAKMANCYDFIMKFPDGFQTEILQNSLSGGQKQRVCIARALLRQPKILLLDEATSALDEESQRIVQEALDVLLEKSNRTTIVVAHRLSTIRNADVIVVMQSGMVVEQGSFTELASKPNGNFRALLKAQEQQAH